jgi:NhaA family Na+:H+ antiporter
MYRVWGFVAEYSLLLIAGALIALGWANIDPDSYKKFHDIVLIDPFFIGHAHADADGHIHRTLTLHFLVNDVLMALFFAVAGKEVWEAIILKNGSLRGRKAMTPLFGTAGGMLGPIAIYLGLAWLWGPNIYETTLRGWAIPTATDIAFSYLIGRIVFGAGHPAVRFLLLLAIADDAAGLIILAIAYPTGELALQWLLLSVAASVIAFVFFNYLPRRKDRGNQDRPYSTAVRKRFGGWPYVIAGCISWYGFQQSGLHPSLGLLPIIPAIPHADRAFGIFSEAEKYLTDMLNVLEHALKYPVQIVLFFFGLLNAGVQFSSIGPATWLVLAGLIIGKPLGILLFGWFAAYPLKLGLPAGMKTSDLFVLGNVAAIGFTVSLFFAGAAFESGPVQEAAKMGALFSFFAAALSIIAGKLLKVEKQES